MTLKAGLQHFKHSAVATLLVVFFCFTFNNVVAQLRTPSSVGNYEKGIVTLENGEVIEGYIFMDMMNPQLFQKKVILIDEKAYAAFKEGEDISKSEVDYDANDVLGFARNER